MLLGARFGRPERLRGTIHAPWARHSGREAAARAHTGIAPASIDQTLHPNQFDSEP